MDTEKYLIEFTLGNTKKKHYTSKHSFICILNADN